MILRAFLTLFFSINLYGVSNSWLSKIDTTIELGIYLPASSGSISNFSNSVDFTNDLGYKNMVAMYLKTEIKLPYVYSPNIVLDYFNIHESSKTVLTKKIQIVNREYDSSITSQINYQVFNFILYKDFMLKGKMRSLLGKRIYSGDLELDVGLNTKFFLWEYEIQDLSNSSHYPSWIKVNELIPLPYLGVKYHLYNIKLYADLSTLSFSSVKSTSYQFGVSYRVVAGLYISTSYQSEFFLTSEDLNTIKYQTDGYKFSFKYAF